jgi:hypothetical protein
VRGLDPALRERLIEVMSRPVADVALRYFPPATVQDVETSQAMLGFELVPAVVDFYRSVANGGHSFLGLMNGAVDDRGKNAVTLYREFMTYLDDEPGPREDEPWSWREGVLPVLYWGCNTYSCVENDGRMIGRDDTYWVADGRSFETWLDDWVSGTLRQPGGSV